MKKILMLLLLSIVFGASLPTVPHEFESRKIIPASWLNDNFDSANNAITDGTSKINVGEIEINGSTFIDSGKLLQIGGLDVTGNMNVDGDFTIGGSQIVSGNQTVVGNQYVSGSVKITGNLEVVGGTEISLNGTLSVENLIVDQATITTMNVGIISSNIISVNLFSSEAIDATAISSDTIYVTTINYYNEWNTYNIVVGGNGTGGGSITATPDYVISTGYYKVIGNTVEVIMRLSGDNGAEGSGTAEITLGLPVTAKNNGSEGISGIGLIFIGTYLNSTYGSLIGTETQSLIGWDAGSITLQLTLSDQNNTSRGLWLHGTYIKE